MKKLHLSFRKPAVAGQTAAAGVSEPGPVPTEAWTYGQTLKNRLVTIGALVALMAVMVAASVVLVRKTTPPPVAQAQTQVDYSRSDAQGVVYAEEYLRTWLTATGDDHKALDAYTETFSDSSIALPAKATTVSEISPVLARTRADGSYVVTLATRTGSPALLRYFEVVLTPLTSDSAVESFAASALPRPVAAPQSQSQSLAEYAQNVSGDAPVRETLSGFFSAYLSGQGDLSRFVSPGVQVAPVAPAPFASVTVTAVNSTAEVPEKATDGTRVDVLVRVVGTEKSGQKSTSDYELSLTARAGRWEVAAMDSPKPPTKTNTTTTKE